MTRYVVITSIFSPSEAVKNYADINNLKVIVIGDKKTPYGWSCDGVSFFGLDEQSNSGYKIAKLLQYDHYSRKMIGYIIAREEGAQSIVDTDDDNVPLIGWHFPPYSADYELISGNLGFINVYQLFTDQIIWPRGLPLRVINEARPFENSNPIRRCNVGIWQGLADEDPDVDAIYRLTSDKPCYFKKRDPIVLGRKTFSPFNSQNTLFRKELFPLLYLPTSVSFRFTDILRGLVAQPIMWEEGYLLGFLEATVVQHRNPHNYMEDFQSEIPMYINCDKAVELVDAAVSSNRGCCDNLYEAYESLLRGGIVKEIELATLEAWLSDITR